MTRDQTILTGAAKLLEQAAALIETVPAAALAVAPTRSARATVADALDMLRDDGMGEFARHTAIVAIHYRNRKDSE